MHDNNLNSCMVIYVVAINALLAAVHGWPCDWPLRTNFLCFVNQSYDIFKVISTTIWEREEVLQLSFFAAKMHNKENHLYGLSMVYLCISRIFFLHINLRVEQIIWALHSRPASSLLSTCGSVWTWWARREPESNRIVLLSWQSKLSRLNKIG